MSRVEDASGETLQKLANAIGSPSHRAAENAKALFPFVLHEASLSGPPGDVEDMGDMDEWDGAEPKADLASAPEAAASEPAVAEPAVAESAGRHPAAPGLC